MGILRWAQCNHKGDKWKRVAGELTSYSMRKTQLTVVALKMEGAMSQGMRVASRSWTRQRTYSPPELPEGMQPWQHLDISPLQPSRLENGKITNLCGFKPLRWL